MDDEIKLETKRPPWECAARKQGTAGGNDPTDCDWPGCQCDPYANKVMAALDEAGFELIKKRSAADAERLRAALTKVRSEIDLSKAPKLMAAIEEALGISHPHS